MPCAVGVRRWANHLSLSDVVSQSAEPPAADVKPPHMLMPFVLVPTRGGLTSVHSVIEDLTVLR